MTACDVMPDTEKRHDDEADIDAGVVARLLAAQFPDLADLPVRFVTNSGTDNVTFRLGDELSVRLPRKASTQQQVKDDARWLPRLAPHLTHPVPELVEMGVPGEGYPFTWGVYRWLAGQPYDEADPADPSRIAADLAGFIRGLQAIDATGAPPPGGHPFERGAPLAPRDAMFREALDELRDELDYDLTVAAWEASLAAEQWDRDPVWIHADLMSGNLLVADDRLSAVIDFGLLRGADPAGDLLPAWYVFDAPARRVFRDELGVDDATWARGRGWALSIQVIAIPHFRKINPDLVTGSPLVVEKALEDFVAER